MIVVVWRDGHSISLSSGEVILTKDSPVLIMVWIRFPNLLIGHQGVLVHLDRIHRRLWRISPVDIWIERWYLILVNVNQLLLDVGIVWLICIFQFLDVVKYVFNFQDIFGLLP